MQVSKVNSIVSGQNSRVPKRQNNKLQKNVNSNIASSSEQVSFKGGVDTLCLGVANAIENGGLAVSFTLQDMLGTNLPRPIMGLMRNSKENKGEKNVKFAAKELVREMMTGPSMFIIPMILLGIGKKALGKTVNVPMKAIKSFGEVHAAEPVNELGKAITKQEFYQNSFVEMIKNAKFEQTPSDETIKTAKEFAKKLSDVTDKKSLKDTVADLGSKFVDITKSHAEDAAHSDFTQAVVKNNKASFKDTVQNMMSYADDVVVKSAKNATSDGIKKMVNNNILRRCAANVFMYAAVLTFLQVIPKLYNKAEGDKNAGLKGLMKEETFGSGSAGDKDTNDKEIKDKNTIKDTEKTGDKSKPSFGSAAGAVNKLTGSSVIGRIAQGIEFEGPNVSFPLLLGIMGFGIILPRVKNSKDKYDREEILRRDVTTCATMCFAEKALRKGFSKFNESRSGFVLADKSAGFKDQSLPKRIFDYIRPIKGVNVMSSEQITAKYSNIDKYKDGVKGFCDFISGQGGKLNKVFCLTEDSKALAQEILGKDKNIETATNAEITQAVEKAKDSEALKKLADLFKLKDKEAPTMFEKLLRLDKGKTNPWIKKAQTLNARFTALSVLVLVPAFLGFFLPWFNEHSTKKRINEELAEKENIQNKPNNYETPKPDVFKDIASFT